MSRRYQLTTRLIGATGLVMVVYGFIKVDQTALGSSSRWLSSLVAVAGFCALFWGVIRTIRPRIYQQVDQITKDFEAYHAGDRNANRHALGRLHK